MTSKSRKMSKKSSWSRVAKNHVPLTQSKLIRLSEKDMEILRKVAKSKGLSVAAFIRLAIFEYLKKEGYERE